MDSLLEQLTQTSYKIPEDEISKKFHHDSSRSCSWGKVSCDRGRVACSWSGRMGLYLTRYFLGFQDFVAADFICSTIIVSPPGT